MASGPDRQQRFQIAVIVFAFWTLVGVCFAGQLYLSRSNIGNPVTWGFALSRALTDWYVFALLSLPTVWLARHFRLEGANWRRNLAVHLGASAAFSLLWMVVRAFAEQLWSRADGRASSFQATLAHALVATFFFNLLIYWVIASVTHAFDYYSKYRDRELRAAELEKRLAQARLQALQMQLNPHFLFNTLHAISALMRKNLEDADRMIARLSDLLRHTFEGTDAQEIPLEQELNFLKRYLEIEQTRFGDRLTVQMEIAPDTLEALVPNLVLQPLVENAIRHGIEPHARPGRIVLQAWRTAGELSLQVRDSGGGQPAGLAKRQGVGLSNTRARLQQLYGAGHRLQFSNAPDGGWIVDVTIPFHTTHEFQEN